jgi:hypothetical protein
MIVQVERLEVPNGLVFHDVGSLDLPTRRWWQKSRIRRLSKPENCWIVSDVPTPIPLAVSQLRNRDAGGWEVDSAFPVLAEWHGAAVVAVQDSALVGIHVVDQATGQSHVANVPQ